MKPVLVIKNIPREGPGLVAQVLHERSMEYCVIEAAEGIPPLTGYSAVCIMGGPASANDTTTLMRQELSRVREALAAGVPLLGVCLGLQVMIKAAGGTVVRCSEAEIGFSHTDGTPYLLELTPAAAGDPLFAGFDTGMPVFQLHGERVVPGKQMIQIAQGRPCREQIIRIGQRAWGLQCHIEITRELLACWCDEDEDLRQLDRESLLCAYDALQPGFEDRGKKVIERFFDLV